MCVVCLMDIKNEINLKFAIARIANTQKTFFTSLLVRRKASSQITSKMYDPLPVLAWDDGSKVTYWSVDDHDCQHFWVP